MFWDGETGFYSDSRWATDPYAEDTQRAYDPNTGRYTSREGDSVTGWGENAYSFAGDNPWSAGRGISSPTGASAHRESSAPSVSEFSVGRGIHRPSVCILTWGKERGISSPTGGSADREGSIPSISEIVVTKPSGRRKNGTVKFFNETKGFGFRTMGAAESTMGTIVSKQKPKPTPTRPHELTGHVTLIK